ncbi:hypothetical protein LJR034_003006 [Caballeronia sp. LjRoot34]|uniref:hypothetical protein n=1 Tax=Caballeronia sp. LjRoot34 TaxID=3342325 RepID=UPI003ED0910F
MKKPPSSSDDRWPGSRIGVNIQLVVACPLGWRCQQVDDFERRHAGGIGGR